MAVELATDANFKELVNNHEKVVVKYFADWCGSCRLFAPKYKRLSDDPRFQGITFLDVNSEMNPEARSMGNVTELPFFAVFKGGKLLQTIASNKEEAIVGAISELD
ncbi:MAG TPA: thioredoxin [Cytophagales bacterium]|nr:thioredoxin [Cytophagales bacterium]HAA22809.1 thioredoxin [Cytophagales bacterium]HAP65316.1 thioredoxin [Cytophagales bacterium]